MKLNIALHFANSIYLTENPTTKLLSLEMTKFEKIHNVTMIPKSWQKNNLTNKNNVIMILLYDKVMNFNITCLRNLIYI